MEDIAIIGKQFSKIVIPLLNNSVRSIDIVVFDWRWYSHSIGSNIQLFNQAIVRAVRRGVRVRAIVNSQEILKPLKDVGCEVKKLDVKNLLHCKFMILDDNKIIIGSHNYSFAAFNLNLELSVLLNNPSFLSDIKTFFFNLWQK